MKFKKMKEEFLSTFTEIHYLVVGVAIGFVSGFILGALFSIYLVKVLTVSLGGTVGTYTLLRSLMKLRK